MSAIVRVASAAPPGPGKEARVPVFKLEAEDGTWLDDVRLSVHSWKPGDKINRGDDTLEVVRVRHDDERDVLVVRVGQDSTKEG
jgi:hypothetical protein